MQYRPKLPENNVNVTPTSPLRDFMLMLLGALGLVAVLYVLLGMAVDFMVPRISPEMEQALGKYLQLEMDESGDSGKQLQQVQALLDRVQDRCGDLPYRLQAGLSESDMINALALPGGRIVLLTGLLNNVRSENELVFVLAHEMGHFANRDHLSELGRGLVFMAMSVSLFGADSTIGNWIGKALEVSELHFSRKHESQADAFALGVQNCYYGHVAGSTDFFAHTEQLDKERFAGHYLSTHPDSRQRVADLERLAFERGYSLEGEKISFGFAQQQ